MEGEQKLFDRRLTYPDSGAAERLALLVGMDGVKDGLAKSLAVLVNPTGLHEWAEKFHKDAKSILRYVKRRPPLIILAGDVGTGKTELAETIGDTVARQEHISVTLLPLSLSTRGSGRVGEMTELLSAAFNETYDSAKRLSGNGSKSKGAVILLVDEGDALAQSRENVQMHHEDRAGVNAFIRGIDRLAQEHLPAAVILCTNRLKAIDPAVHRRAANVFEFSRPNDEQRRSVVEQPLKDVGFSDMQIDEVVKLTGSKGKTKLGFTYSDLTQRFLPTLVLDAYPDNAIDYKRAIEVLRKVKPTPRFNE
jgi:AAA+ superfamily predicted ATPase